MKRPTRAERQRSIESALHAVDELRHAAILAEKEHAAALAAVVRTQRASAINLAHYLAVRRHDIRELQAQLSHLGLSSLGRMEAHVLASLDAVHDTLLRLNEQHPGHRAAPAASFTNGPALLHRHADAILGTCTPDRPTRIMVTIPSEAADDAALVHDMVANGMDIARINCAHDDTAVWARMVQNIRAAERSLGRRCRISFDLAGPKLRTGPIAPGPQVMKWRPQRDPLGLVLSPARVHFHAVGLDVAAGGNGIPVHGDLLAKAQRGDTLELTDARGRRRRLEVVGATGSECLCEADETAYVVPGLGLTLRRDGKRLARGKIGALPAVEQAIALRPGDTLTIHQGDAAGHDAVRDHTGQVLHPASIGCALEEVFAGVRRGDRICFDDGRIGGIVRRAEPEHLEVEIVSAAGGTVKLRGEKGINLPDSQLDLAALTPKDLADLAFVAKHGDMVAMSFVQRPDDIEQLLAEMSKLGTKRLGVVLKIETRRAFENLPALIFSAMRHSPVAVMVARGDLGVEVGFERLSEIQEEILWIAEAAHVPVIWATQVLESLAKGGMPSRAEVTDAAMSSRAECVMLNKGPYIHETLRFLVDVLARMAEHQNKKSSLLRKLQVSEPRRERRPARSRLARANRPR
jgi:pyruvate kinase